MIFPQLAVAGRQQTVVLRAVGAGETIVNVGNVVGLGIVRTYIGGIVYNVSPPLTEGAIHVPYCGYHDTGRGVGLIINRPVHVLGTVVHPIEHLHKQHIVVVDGQIYIIGNVRSEHIVTASMDKSDELMQEAVISGVSIVTRFGILGFKAHPSHLGVVIRLRSSPHTCSVIRLALPKTASYTFLAVELL